MFQKKFGDSESAEGETPNSLLTKSGKVKPAGLISAKKPTLAKFGSSKANGLARKAKP